VSEDNDFIFRNAGRSTGSSAMQKVYEQPTAKLRWLKDTLQQCWRIQWRDENTDGAANPETYEWRDVPREMPGVVGSPRGQNG